MLLLLQKWLVGSCGSWRLIMWLAYIARVAAAALRAMLLLLLAAQVANGLTRVQGWVIAIKTKNSITKYITNYFKLCNWNYQLK